MRRPSFSRRLKDELLNLEFEQDEDRLMWFCCALAAAGVFRGTEVSIKSAHKAFVDRVSEEAADILGFEGEITEKKAYSLWQLTDADEADDVRCAMEDQLDFDSTRGTMGLKAEDFSREEQIAALRAFFLSCGSMADPTRSYQIEFSLRRQTVAEFIRDILHIFEIESVVARQYPYHMIYIKSGEHILTFLGEIGAHTAYLNFENTRVIKSVNAMANRAVNCDSANMQRVADTAARQLELLRALEEAGGLTQLPEDLREVAKVRMENPSASIRELGESMCPPLGKSGVYHRLGRLETWARNYLEDKEV